MTDTAGRQYRKIDHWAAEIDCPRKTLWRACRAKQLRCIRLGRSYRVNGADLDRWLDGLSQGPEESDTP